MRALEEFIENVRNEQASQLPKDGTVHELTSNVLMFLEHLTDYMDTVANVLAQDPNYLTPSPGSKVLDENTKRSLLGAYISTINEIIIIWRTF
jgi:exocyst complex protein 7